MKWVAKKMAIVECSIFFWLKNFRMAATAGGGDRMNSPERKRALGKFTEVGITVNKRAIETAPRSKKSTR